MRLKSWLSLLLALMFLLPAGAPAESSVNWLYSFSAGEVLSGREMNGIRDFLDAVQLSLTSRQAEGLTSGRAELLSRGKPVFFLQAALSDSGEMGLACSLTGNCTLMCRQDQIGDFLGTIVRMLAERSILKESALDQADMLAETAGNALIALIRNSAGRDFRIGINPDAYLNRISAVAAEAEVRELDGQDPECPGALLKRTWILSEAELNALADTGIRRLKQIPILSDEFEKGSIRIGKQRITEPFLRELFASMHGETVLEAYQDPDGQVLLMRLLTPELSDFQEDPLFSRIRGIAFSVSRSGSLDEGVQESLTEMRLIGLEGSVLAIRMQKGPGSDIPPLPSGKVYQVGDMDSRELWDLIGSLRLTIAANAVGLILDLPRIVFDTLVDRIF